MHGNDGSFSYTTHALIRNPKAHGTPKANAMYLYATKVLNDFDKVLPGCTASRLGQLTQVVLYAAKCSAIEIITARLHKHVRLVRLSVAPTGWLVATLTRYASSAYVTFCTLRNLHNVRENAKHDSLTHDVYGEKTPKECVSVVVPVGRCPRRCRRVWQRLGRD